MFWSIYFKDMTSNCFPLNSTRFLQYCSHNSSLVILVMAFFFGKQYFSTFLGKTFQCYFGKVVVLGGTLIRVVFLRFLQYYYTALTILLVKAVFFLASSTLDPY